MSHIENYLLWKDVENHPAVNMAKDEALLSFSYTNKIPILRFYSWDRPAISIGYVQNYEKAAKDGYYVIRRPTGGGIVFHDIDLTYSVVIPSGHQIEKLRREESYYFFHSIIICALKKIGLDVELTYKNTIQKERSTMQCFSAPVRFDVALKNPSFGHKKVAGAAQRRTKEGILHQGSIVLPDINGKRNELIEAIISVFKTAQKVKFLNFKPDSEFIRKVAALVSTKYETDAWNQKLK